MFLFIMFGIIPSISQTIKLGDLEYSIDDTNNAAYVVGCLASQNSDVIIPSQIQNNGVVYEVTLIGPRAFKTPLNSLTIPGSVTCVAGWNWNGGKDILSYSIKKLIFQNGAQPLVIESTTTSLHYQTQYYLPFCPKEIYIDREISKGLGGFETLETVVFGPNLTEIPNYFFSYCEALTSIDIPDNITKIGNSSFCNCINLSDIRLPNTLRYIGESAFEGCKIKSIYLPESLELLGDKAFANCSMLKSVYMASLKVNESIVISSYKDYCVPFDDLHLESYWGGKLEWSTYFSPRTTIDKVFWLPNTKPEIKGREVTYVSTSNISTDDDLKRVDFLSSNFVGDNGLRYIPISPQQRSAMLVDFNYQNDPTEITIPDLVSFKGIQMEVLQAGNYCLSDLENLKQIKVEAHLSEIPDGFASNCRSLQNFTVDRYPDRIGVSAFEGCASLKEFTMVDWNSNVEVGRHAFKGAKIEKLRIGRQLVFPESEEDAPFANITTLKNL